MTVDAQEIYAFPSGELRAEHYAELAAAMRPVFPAASRLAVVLDSASMRFGADDYDETTGRAVLDYTSRDRALERLEELFVSADPELFFAHGDPLGAVVEHVREYDAARLAHVKARGEQGLWRRLTTPSPIFEIGRTALVRAYAPVVVYREDGTFCVHRSSS